MSNLALKKHPLESNWVDPHHATDGNVDFYDTQNGFSYASWPAKFTIDLELEQPITIIRFLLWDGLGSKPGIVLMSGLVKDKRKYNFSLSVSTDNINYSTVYSNIGIKGGNGWYSFGFVNPIYARFVRLNCEKNSDNPAFHIVEFEIHNGEAPEISSKNYQHFSVPNAINTPSNNVLRGLIDSILIEKSAQINTLIDQISQSDKNLSKSREFLEGIQLIKSSTDFTKQSIDNFKYATRWLIASGSLLITFLALLVYFIFCDSHSKEIILDASTNIHVREYTSFLLIAFYASKAILLSTILFSFGWFLKNYRSEMHNYTVNKHKAMSLTVAIGIMTNQEYKSIDRISVFNLAVTTIFSHQPSGYSEDKNENKPPSVANTLFNNKELPLSM